LGDEWLRPDKFRFGASGLLDDIEKVVLKCQILKNLLTLSLQSGENRTILFYVFNQLNINKNAILSSFCICS